MSKSSESFPLVVLVLLAAAVSACERQPLEVASAEATGAQAVHAAAASTQGALLARIRAATARYHRLEAALEDGYERRRFPFPPFDPIPCIEGEGIRYVNLSAIDGVVEPTRPELLLYEPLPNGKLRLAGVQYLVPASEWDPSQGIPHLGDQPFMDRRLPPWGGPAPNYSLVVWLWTHNPDGMYELQNPRVSC
jgi:hypothetical protein